MANYHIDNLLAGTQQAMTTSYKTLVEILAQTSGLRRTKWYGFNVGPSANPASTDTDLQFDVSRATATGTGTSATPNPLDPAEGVAHSACEVNHTGEGTVTAASSLAYVAMNQRATYAWQTNDASQMLVGPATNAAGLVLRAKSVGSYTGTVGATVYWNE